MSNKDARRRAAEPAPYSEAPSLYAKNGQRKYLNLAERCRVLGASALRDAAKGLFVETLAWTGARISEVLALTAASFQIEESIVAIVTLKRRRFVVREVPLPPRLMKRLDELFDLKARQADPDRASKRLWTWHRVTAWRFLKEVMREAGIAGPSACPRGLRHGFGVGTIRAGVPLNLVQRWLGHARISTTAIYADASGPEERAIAERFWSNVG